MNDFNLGTVIEDLCKDSNLQDPENVTKAIETIAGMYMGIIGTNIGSHVVAEAESSNNQDKKTSDKIRFPDDVKFSFYGVTQKCNNHNGIIVIASRVGNEVVEYGVAYCSPKDVYNKERGKVIALHDLNYECKMVTLSGKRHHLINARIMADVIANADAPSWAEERVAYETARHLYHSYPDAFDITVDGS